MNRHQLVILGGGPTGCVAALAAARAGVDVLLVEKGGFLGGTATAAMVGPWMAFHAGGRAIVGGIAQEIVDRLRAMGGSPGHVPDPLGVCGSLTPFDSELLKILLFQLVREAGVKVLLHSFATGLERSAEGILALDAVNKSGPCRLEASHFLDTSGDADLAAWAGADTECGRAGDGLPQPMTAMFKVGGVRTRRLLDYVRAHPDEFVLGMDPDRLEEAGCIALSGFYAQVEAARARGDFTVNRDRVLVFGLPRPGEYMVNMTRIQGLHGHVGEDLSRAEEEGYHQIAQVFTFLRRDIPGFEDAWLLQTPAQIGIRETRRLVGAYVLTAADVLSGATFPDSIAMGGFPIDIHAPDGTGVDCPQGQGRAYQVPYRCLLPPSVPNLLVAGRCLSATFEAHASARITPTCMAMGHAAGLAAHLAVGRDVPFREVPAADIQQALAGKGGLFR